MEFFVRTPLPATTKYRLVRRKISALCDIHGTTRGVSLIGAIISLLHALPYCSSSDPQVDPFRTLCVVKSQLM